LARISAVQQMIGASGFTEASPVIIPTWSDPKSRHRAKNFSLTSALIGAVYTLRLPAASAAKWAAAATSDLPDPVGVLRMTWLPRTVSKIASSCAGYSSRPSSSA
jgi:hypothetical protein